jgi:Raf kinase inhibitor-like YbhB/YbcL family protein
MIRRAALFGSACLATLAATSGLAKEPVRPDAFIVSSPDFTDDGEFVQANAGVGPSRRGPWQCGGQNVSPAISWTRPPASAKSFGVIMFDPDGSIGAGSIHWVAYGIAADASGLGSGEASKPSKSFVGGSNDRKLSTYFGPCPEPGDVPHHYIIQVFALDLPRDALPAGLSKDDFMQRIHGHAVAEASLVARY